MRTRRLLLISCAPRRGRSRATPGTQAGAESPAGRAGEAARRTAPFAAQPEPHRDGTSAAVHVRDRRAGGLADVGSGQAPVSSSRSVDRCARWRGVTYFASPSASSLPCDASLSLSRETASAAAVAPFASRRPPWHPDRHGTRENRGVEPVGDPHPEGASPSPEDILRYARHRGYALRGRGD